MDSTGQASVVIACHTQERWAMLAAAIDSARIQGSRLGEVIVVVDNNLDLLTRLGQVYPDLTVVANERSQGASGARNTGALHARGEFLAFLDDDEVAAPSWLDNLLQPFSSANIVGTGGGWDPAWQGGRPAWFPDEFGWVVGADYVGGPTSLSRVRNVWSGNMAVRASVFRAVGGFRDGFGKIGSRSSPEDTELCIRMSSSVQDGHWIYVPTARISHHVPRDRSSFSFFVKRCYNEGQSKVKMARLLGPQEQLTNERSYIGHTLPLAIAAGIKEAAHDKSSEPLRRVASIAVGTGAAGFGFLSATLTTAILARRSAVTTLQACPPLPYLSSAGT